MHKHSASSLECFLCAGPGLPLDHFGLPRQDGFPPSVSPSTLGCEADPPTTESNFCDQGHLTWWRIRFSEVNRRDVNTPSLECLQCLVSRGLDRKGSKIGSGQQSLDEGERRLAARDDQSRHSVGGEGPISLAAGPMDCLPAHFAMLGWGRNRLIAHIGDSKGRSIRGR